MGAEGDCDHRTGQCVCKKNVVGFKCTECGPYSYNYTSGEGCYDCDCHSIGAIDQQCDVVSRGENQSVPFFVIIEIFFTFFLY